MRNPWLSISLWTRSMGDVQYPDTLRKFVAEMATLERQIEEALDQWMPEVQGHVEAAEVIKQFQTMVKGQREAMEACLVGTPRQRFRFSHHERSHSRTFGRSN